MKKGYADSRMVAIVCVLHEPSPQAGHGKGIF